MLGVAAVFCFGSGFGSIRETDAIDLSDRTMTGRFITTFRMTRTTGTIRKRKAFYLYSQIPRVLAKNLKTPRSGHSHSTAAY